MTVPNSPKEPRRPLRPGPDAFGPNHTIPKNIVTPPLPEKTKEDGPA